MVTKDDVLKIAKLAKLSVNEEEIESLAGAMQNMIDFADEIGKIDIGDSDFDNINGLTNELREDIVEQPFERDLILKNVGGGKKGYFCLKNYNK